MRQGVLVDFLEMTIAMVLVDRKACFSHDVTQLIHAFPLHFLCPLVLFVAIGSRLAIELKADTGCNRVDRFGAADASTTWSSLDRLALVLLKSRTWLSENCSGAVTQLGGIDLRRSLNNNGGSLSSGREGFTRMGTRFAHNLP